MKTLKFQAIFYSIIGLCIVIIILSFKSFDFIEANTAMAWTMKYFAIPIVVILIPISSFIYLNYLMQYEQKNYESKLKIKLRTLFRIFF